jgi:UDP-N-acetylmuramate--alanine ligase
MHSAEIKKVHFIGVGGIGMSALAYYFISKKIKVSGYDKIQSSITSKLVSNGAEIFYEDDITLIDDINSIDLVIYTPAINYENKQLTFFQNHDFNLLKRSDVLGEISNLYKTIAVAGTHGKTTISSMVAHILKTAHKVGACFVGGITSNYESNFLLGNGDLSVMEADEYDKSFLKLNPDSIVLTSIDPDHLDIYGTKENLHNSFLEFSKLLKNQNKFIVEESISKFFDENLVYGFGDQCNLRIINVKISNGKYLFDFSYGGIIHKDFSLKMPGKYNLLNAAGAALACIVNEISLDEIRIGLSSYKGVKRRFEIQFDNSKITYIDDYAHHPNEIISLLSAVKEFYPDKKLIGIFQPHLFSRTQDFLNEFAQSLSLLDDLFLLPIYPAREKPIEGVSSDVLLEKVNLDNKKLIHSPSELFTHLDLESDFLLLTIGAGDIDQWVDDLIKYLQSR